MAVKLGEQTLAIKALKHKAWMDCQMRTRMVPKKIVEYAEKKRARPPARFPPAEVLYDPETQTYWLADGFHRVLADERNGEKATHVFVALGTKQDAIVRNIECNLKDTAIPFQPGDKSRAIKYLLQHPDWASKNDREIARFVEAAASLVGKIRRDGRFSRSPRSREHLQPRNREIRRRRSEGQTLEEIAIAVGLTPEGVSAVLKGGRRNHRGSIRAEQREEVLSGFCNGETVRQIADRLGIDATGIYAFISIARHSGRLIKCECCKGNGWRLA